MHGIVEATILSPAKGYAEHNVEFREAKYDKNCCYYMIAYVILILRHNRIKGNLCKFVSLSLVKMQALIHILV